ncbi:hypothetical protein ACLKA6_011300 [Drosophila palustris]
MNRNKCNMEEIPNLEELQSDSTGQPLARRQTADALALTTNRYGNKQQPTAAAAAAAIAVSEQLQQQHQQQRRQQRSRSCSSQLASSSSSSSSSGSDADSYTATPSV